MQIVHRTRPDHILWETASDGQFLSVEVAAANVRSFGTPQGAFEVDDTIADSWHDPEITSIGEHSGDLRVSGRLSGTTGAIDFEMTFTALDPSRLRFRISASGNGTPNRILLRLASTLDEAFFGFGQQLTYFNQKGHRLPILVQEHGVGRGRLAVTRAVDMFANGGGGNPFITEAPAPHFLSSRLRSMFLENTEYSVFDLRPADHLEVKVWSGVMTGQILSGDGPLDLIEAYTLHAGRMRELPDWIHQGVIVAIQGGTDAVRTKLASLQSADVPLAGLWIQDWSGVRVTSAGKQLWWNWRLDREFYPQWSELVAELERSGARMLIYINPFLSMEEGHDELFRVADAEGHLVRQADGTPYLIRNTDFLAGLLDLTNARTRDWIKEHIKEELIGTAGASGWMADFGEALPFDAKLADGADPATWHNRFPEAWAEVNRAAIEEAGRSDDIVFFNRSAFTRSPAAATLFWLGDQTQTWDGYDGIKTAVVGMLSGGISGFSLLHSDTGGYVSLSLRVAGRKMPVIARTDELLQRWIELAAFTPVFRTHEGLDPAVAAQFDSNPANLAHLARFARIYKTLAPYRKRLVAEAARRGHPVVRHPFLHYPDDPNTHALRYQFMLGPDLMVAPVLDRGARTVEVYLPPGDQWSSLWRDDAEAPLQAGWNTVAAPLGRPPVFVRTSENAYGGPGSPFDSIAGL